MSQPQAREGKLASQLHARKLEVTEMVQQNVSDNVESMVQASLGETTALNQLTEKLQQAKEDVALRVEATLTAQHKTAAADDEQIHHLEEASQQSVPGAEGNEGAVTIQKLQLAQEELSQLKTDLAVLESTTVPTMEHAAMELHLTSVVKHNKQLQEHVEELTATLQEQGGGSAQHPTPGARPLPITTSGTTGSSKFDAHPAQTAEVVLLTRKVLQDDDARSAIEERESLARENGQLRKRLTDLEFRTKLISQDAQDITVENGVLKSQLANLLFKHREVVPLELQGMLSQPMREGDLAAFGNYTLPSIKELTGVSLVAPLLSDGAVDFGSFSVDNIFDLVERCSELTKELFRATQGRYVIPGGNGVGGDRVVGTKCGRDEDDDDVPGAAGMLRPLPPSIREVAPMKKDIAVQCDALSRVLEEGNANIAGLGIEDFECAEDEGDVHQQLYDTTGPEVSMMSRASAGGSVHRGRASNYISADCVGTESLVVAVVKASERQGDFETQTLVRRAQEETQAHESLLAAMGFINELESELVSARSDLLSSQAMVADLQTSLAVEQSKNVDMEHVTSVVQDRVFKPLEGLQTNQDALLKILESASDDQRVVAAAMEESRSEMLQISSTFASQEEAISIALSQVISPVVPVMEGDAEDNQRATGRSTMPRWSLLSQQTAGQHQTQQLNQNLRQEIQSLREKLAAEQTRTGELYSKLQEAQTKVDAIAERQWSMEAYKEDYEAQLAQQEETLKTMLSPQEAESLTSQIQQLTETIDIAEAKSKETEAHFAAQKEELNASWAKDKNEIHSLNTQLGNADFRLQQVQQRLSAAENDAAEAQKCEQNAQEQLEVVAASANNFNQQLQLKIQEVESLEQQVEELKGRLLSLDVSRELILQIFPDNQAVIASTHRLGVLELEKRTVIQRCADAERHLKAATEEQQRSVDETRDLRLAVDRLETTQMAVQAEAQAAVEVAEQRADTCAHEANVANTRCGQATTELEDLQAAYADLQQRLEVFKSDPATLNVRKYGVQYTLSLEDQMEELHTLKLSVEEECEKLTEDVAVLTGKSEELQAHISTLERTSSELEEEVEGLKAAQSSAKEELAKRGEQCERLESSLAEEQASTLAKQSEIDELKQGAAQGEATLAELRAQRESLESDIQQHLEFRRNLEAQLHEARTGLDAATKSLAEAKRESSLIKAENDRLADDGIQLQSECDRLITEVMEIKAQGGPGPGSRMSHRGGTSGSVRKSRGGPSLMGEIRKQE